MDPINKRLPKYTEVYFSVDIEADGLLGVHSMSSFAACVAGEFDGKNFRRLDPESATFYRELKPISDDFVPEAAAVSGLDRDKLIRDGAEPRVAMREFEEWVLSTSAGRRPVFVAWPASFDWSFIYVYFNRFNDGKSPFGFSGCLDMKTLYHRLRNTTLSQCMKSRIPAEMHSKRPHTHNALDDALEQADLFANMFTSDPRVKVLD